MNTEEHIPPHAKRMAWRLKLVGWWFLLIGSIVCIQPVYVVFRPDATISVNGVPTHSLPTKLGVALFAIMFPLIGNVLALTPRITMQKRIVSFGRWAKEWVEHQSQYK